MQPTYIDSFSQRHMTETQANYPKQSLPKEMLNLKTLKKIDISVQQYFKATTTSV
jgi:hypothetical protein